LVYSSIKRNQDTQTQKMLVDYSLFTWSNIDIVKTSMYLLFHVIHWCVNQYGWYLETSSLSELICLFLYENTNCWGINFYAVPIDLLTSFSWNIKIQMVILNVCLRKKSLWPSILTWWYSEQDLFYSLREQKWEASYGYHFYHLNAKQLILSFVSDFFVFFNYHIYCYFLTYQFVHAYFYLIYF